MGYFPGSVVCKFPIAPQLQIWFAQVCLSYREGAKKQKRIYRMRFLTFHKVFLNRDALGHFSFRQFFNQIGHLFKSGCQTTGFARLQE